MTNRKLEKEMKRFLMKLDKNEFVDYNDPTIKQCVYECNKRGYVSGFRNCSRMADNSIYFDLINPCLEKEGYEYLYPKKDLIAIGTLIASILTAVGVLLQLVLSVVK
ncbi:MAG: hypothetical protein J6D53_09340 [Blautia sp.]|nr:hypothetical protein [Blautia sp.]